MPHRETRVWRDLARASEIRAGRLVVSVLAGTLALGFAVGLAAVAAWLIARAAGMPSPADLAVAAVVVRFFGIGRGVFRYAERLASHDTALRATVALRARAYDAVARSRAVEALTLRRGEIMARMGTDIEAIGDVVVRAFIPLCVAATVSAISVAISMVLLPAAGLALLASLLLAGFGAAGLAWRQSRLAAHADAGARGVVAAASLAAMEHGTERRVWGAESDGDLARAESALEHAVDLGARSGALASAVQVAAAGMALVASVALAIRAGNAGEITPMAVAVVALLPLASFEAVGAVPGAVNQAFRARAAAARLGELTGGLAALAAPPSQRDTAPAPRGTVLDTARTLEAVDVQVAWPGMEPTRPVSARLEPGGALGIVGRSGVGKSTLLLSLAGARGTHAGRVLVGGRPVTEADTGTVIALTPEDAHLFGTSILENLRVARGDVTEAEATAALDAVALGPWLRTLPDGLHTLVGAGGGSVSGGERRRLLLARALLSRAPIHLIDEPAEHLDADGIAALRALVLAMRARGHSVVIVTHDLAILDVVDRVVNLDD